MFRGLFKMDEKCPHCGARYERLSGESIGVTMLNLSLAETLSMGGYIVTQALFSPPLVFQLTFWVSFNSSVSFRLQGLPPRVLRFCFNTSSRKRLV